MPYRIAGIDVHKKMLAVVVSDVEIESEFQFARSPALGKIARSVFSFHPRAALRFPRQVRGRSAAGLP